MDDRHEISSFGNVMTSMLFGESFSVSNNVEGNWSNGLSWRRNTIISIGS